MNLQQLVLLSGKLVKRPTDRARLSHWQGKDGQERQGLSITAALLSRLVTE
jgi:hypothetical protein